MMNSMILFRAILLTLLFPATAFAASDVNWNVSTNPIALILGPNARLHYKLNDHWTFGPEVAIVAVNVGNFKASGFDFGIDAKYYFDEALTQHGWFISGGLSYGSIKYKYTDSSNNNKESNANVRMATLRGIGGYQWFWGHFNLALGGGLSFASYNTNEVTDENGNKTKDVPIHPVNLAADASLGWTF